MPGAAWSPAAQILASRPSPSPFASSSAPRSHWSWCLAPGLEVVVVSVVMMAMVILVVMVMVLEWCVMLVVMVVVCDVSGDGEGMWCYWSCSLFTNGTEIKGKYITFSILPHFFFLSHTHKQHHKFPLQYGSVSRILQQICIFQTEIWHNVLTRNPNTIHNFY